MSTLPILSILSVIITSIVWRKQRNRKEDSTNFHDNFVILNNKWVSRRNNGLLIIDAFVTAYFALVTPDMPGYFYILLLSTTATVHSILLSFAGLYEKLEVNGSEFTYTRFMRDEISFYLEDILYVETQKNELTLQSNFGKLLTIRYHNMDVQGLELLFNLLQSKNLTNPEDLPSINQLEKQKGAPHFNVAMHGLLVLQAALLATIFIRLTLFKTPDELFIYGAQTYIEVLYGYQEWLLLLMRNVTLGVSIVYGFNLGLIILLRLTHRFTSLFTLQCALSLFAIIIVLSVDMMDFNWTLEQVKTDIAAIEADELETRLLYYVLDWETEQPFALFPGEYEILTRWTIRDMDNNPATLIFPRALCPAELRAATWSEVYEIPNVNPSLRIIEVVYTPALHIVVSVTPANYFTNHKEAIRNVSNH